MQRWILHVDMDEFFAAVERLDDPSLAGKPLLVGGSAAGRGVVSTASYEARKFGCHSAMPMAQAVRRCPQAIVLPVRGQRYSEVSRAVFDIFRRFTPLVEPLSIDEAFLDVTGTERLHGPAEQVAENIKRAIREELHLVASVGVAPNKFLAKLASDLEKPDGLTIIEPRRVHDILDPLPVRKLWGIGPAAERGLKQLGISTIGQLRMFSAASLKRALGNSAEHFLRLATGIDHRPVTPDHEAKSIGQEQTFPSDLDDRELLLAVLFGQLQEVARRLRRAGLLARTVTLKLRHGDFTTLSRSRTLDKPTDLTDPLWETAKALFNDWARYDFQPLRLAGVTLSNLEAPGGEQLDLFDPPEDDSRQRQLDQTVDHIVEKFGKGVIRRGPGTETER
jgi:DNA polymerase-4